MGEADTSPSTTMPSSGNTSAWIKAMRLRTLPLAASSVLAGAACSPYHEGLFWTIFILALLTCLALQVFSNLANDYGDFMHGTDNDQRIGPKRMVQSGAISAGAMLKGILWCGSVAFALGLLLLWMALGQYGRYSEMAVFLGIGIVCIGAAYAYTATKKPYGYAGLGDLAVLLFFGVIGVGGTAYLIGGSWDFHILIPALGIGLLSTAVLNLNNLRDHINDERSGKKTMVVRLGFRAGKGYQFFLVIGGLILLFSTFYYTLFLSWIFLILPLIPLRILMVHLMFIGRVKEPSSIDPELKKVALAVFFLSFVFFLSSLYASLVEFP